MPLKLLARWQWCGWFCWLKGIMRRNHWLKTHEDELLRVLWMLLQVSCSWECECNEGCLPNHAVILFFFSLWSGWTTSYFSCCFSSTPTSPSGSFCLVMLPLAPSDFFWDRSVGCLFLDYTEAKPGMIFFLQSWILVQLNCFCSKK